MKPNLGDGKVNKILTNFSLRYSNGLYIAEQILPPLPVKEITGKYAKYGKENLRAYVDQIFRAPGTRAHTIDYSVSQGDYTCRERSLEKLVPDEFRDNMDDPYDAGRDAVKCIMDNISVNEELALATAMASTSIMTKYTTISASTDKWTDKTNSDPMANIRTAVDAITSNSGMIANVLVFCWDAWKAFKDNPGVQELVKYTNGGSQNYSDSAMKRFLIDYFDLEEVLVGRAVYISSEEGQSTDTLTQVWTGNVWALCRAKTPSLMQATFGLTLYDNSAGGPAIITDTYREEPKRSDVVRVHKSFDQNLFDVNLGYLLKSVV
jgi:hypothetical protein